MAEDPTREEQVSLAHVREKFDNWINASGNHGKVYTSTRPDLWAVGIALALILVFVGLALSLVGLEGLAMVPTIAGIVIGVVSVALHGREV